MKKNKSRSPFGKLLARYRKEKGLTMKALGEAVGISESYVSLLESGDRKQPSRELVLKFARALGASSYNNVVDDFLVTAGYYPTNKQSYSQHGSTLQAYRTQLEQDPQDFVTYTALIFALIKTGETREAQEMIQQGLGRFDDSVQLQSLLGSLELAKENFDKAITLQKFALELAHQSTPPLPDEAYQRLQLNLGVMHFLFGYDLSQKAQRALRDHKNSDAEAWKNSAQAEFQNAYELFQTLLRLQPHNIYILDEYARVCFNLAHLDLHSSKRTDELWRESITHLQAVLRADDKFSLGNQALFEACIFLAHAYSKIERFEQAENLIMSFEVTLAAPHWLVYYLKACFYSLKAESKSAASHDLDRAFEALKSAHELNSEACAQAAYDPDLKELRRVKKDDIRSMMT